MADAEMVIRLVDASPDEQAALDTNPNTQREPVESTSVEESSRKIQEASAPVGRPEGKEGEPKPLDPANPNAVIRGTSEFIDSIDTLTSRIGDLIQTLSRDNKSDSKDEANTSNERGSDSKQESTSKKSKDKSDSSKSESAKSESDASTADVFRDMRLAIIDLSRRFTPKWFSEPLEKLLAPLAKSKSSSDKQPSTTTTDKTSTERPSAEIPTVQAPKTKDKKEDSVTKQTEPTARDVINNITNRMESTKLGKRFVSAGRTVGKAFRGAARSVGNMGRGIAKRLNRTRIGRSIVQGTKKAGNAVSSLTRKAAGRVASSSLGKASGAAAKRVAGMAVRTVAAIATRGRAGAVAAGAGAGGATVGAGAAGASGAAAGAGGAGATVAAVAAPVAAAVLAVGAFAIMCKAAADSLHEMTEELDGMSSDIASARAQAQATTQRNLLARARAVGPEMGQIEKSRNRLGDAQERLMTSMLGILTKAAPVIELGVDKITVVVETLNVIVAWLGKAYADLTLDQKDDKIAQAALDKAWISLEKSRQEILRNGGDRDETQEAYEQFMQLGGNANVLKKRMIN